MAYTHFSSSDVNLIDRPSTGYESSLRTPHMDLTTIPTKNLEVADLTQTKNCASPFYCHPTTTTSAEQLKAVTIPYTASNRASMDRDTLHRTNGTSIQASEHNSELPPKTPKSMVTIATTEASGRSSNVWPDRKDLEEQRNADKQRRMCFCLRGLTKKQRLLVKLMVGFLIIAIAVSIGVGTSIAVGGRVYRGSNSSVPVGSTR